MRISVVNFCSFAVDMLDFSCKEAVKNAGGVDMDLFLVMWNPSSEVQKWSEEHPEWKAAYYMTQPKLDYVPNLRALMNTGFDIGLMHNEYVAPINTDMAFGKNWLANLAKHASEDVIPNSVHVTPAFKAPHAVTLDFGQTTYAGFQMERWEKYVQETSQDKVLTEDDVPRWHDNATFPYILHRKWWKEYGPWRPEMRKADPYAPDRTFFFKVHAGGAKYWKALDSICYHVEAAERKSGRPVGVENMPNGR